MAATAESLPGYYPPSFQGDGIVNQVSNSQLVVNARRLAVDSNVRVHTPATEFSSMSAVRKGTEIGFNSETRANGRTSIIEIWVLPPGTVLVP